MATAASISLSVLPLAPAVVDSSNSGCCSGTAEFTVDRGSLPSSVQGSLGVPVSSQAIPGLLPSSGSLVITVGIADEEGWLVHGRELLIIAMGKRNVMDWALKRELQVFGVKEEANSRVDGCMLEFWVLPKQHNDEGD